MKGKKMEKLISFPRNIFFPILRNIVKIDESKFETTPFLTKSSCMYVVLCIQMELKELFITFYI